MSVVYQYLFSQALPVGEIEAALLRSLITAEYLHGSARVRLDACHYLDPEPPRCVLDATTPVGEDVNKIFVGSLQAEFGSDSFSVQRISAPLEAERTLARPVTTAPPQSGHTGSIESRPHRQQRGVT